MFSRSAPGGMSSILRFNILAASACATYYLWSKYSNWRSLQAEYCTEALTLLRDYPEVRQILGSHIRLTKLLSGARSRDDLVPDSTAPFTDLSQAGRPTGPASVQVKCEVKGSKAAGQLFLWASRGGAVGRSTALPPTASPSLEFDPLTTTGSSQQVTLTTSDGFFAPSSQSAASSAGWAIDKLALQIPTPTAAAKKSSGSQLRWTVYESFASLRGQQQAKNRQFGQAVIDSSGKGFAL